MALVNLRSHAGCLKLLCANTPFVSANKGVTNDWMLQAVLLGFNTSANVYILMSLSAPVYNYTTNTVNFNYLLKTPNATAATNATNGFLVNLFVTQPDTVSGAVPMTDIPKETILFTPSLLTTIPCTNSANVTAGSCTINNSPTTACATALHGQWKNGTFCA